MNPIYLNGRPVGDKQPAYFIAEIGGNFKNEDEVIKLVGDAIESGADAIKFQTFEAETVTIKENYFSFNGAVPVSQYESLKKSQTSKELQKFVFNYAREKGIAVFSAPSHMNDIEFMERELSMPIYKIGSDLACHIPLLKEVARLNKPIILSTGMTTISEIEKSVETILNEGNEQLVLLHCVSNYPCDPSEVNLNAMGVMREKFKLPVGYSDHTLGIEVSLAAVALGACMIERHFTFDKNADGPDHILSSTCEEMKVLINYSKNIQASLGEAKKQPTSNEMRHRLYNRVGINTTAHIEKGQIITAQMIDIRRPATGILAKDWNLVLGRQAQRSVKCGTPLQWADLE